MSTVEAARKLLQGSGLEVSADGSGRLTISPASVAPGAAAAAGPMQTLPEVQVRDMRETP